MEDTSKQSKQESEEPQFQVLDKRHFMDLDNLDRTPVEEKPRYPAFVEELMARTAETEKKGEKAQEPVYADPEAVFKVVTPSGAKDVPIKININKNTCFKSIIYTVRIFF